MRFHCQFFPVSAMRLMIFLAHAKHYSKRISVSKKHESQDDLLRVVPSRRVGREESDDSDYCDEGGGNDQTRIDELYWNRSPYNCEFSSTWKTERAKSYLKM